MYLDPIGRNIAGLGSEASRGRFPSDLGNLDDVRGISTDHERFAEAVGEGERAPIHAEPPRLGRLGPAVAECLKGQAKFTSTQRRDFDLTERS